MNSHHIHPKRRAPGCQGHRSLHSILRWGWRRPFERYSVVARRVQATNEALAADADQHGNARRHKLIDVSEQLQVVFDRFTEADTGIDPCLLYTSDAADE